MNCSRCRHENPVGVKFCGECGVRLESPCPSCQAANPPTNKFCHDCGGPLFEGLGTRSLPSPEAYTPKHLVEKILTSKSAIEGERKQVTVLFADLKGSMELLADRDPEEARKLLDPVLEHMMEAVHRYEGTVNQVMGDGIMALFGAPLAQEDHAVRACYAALRMQEVVRRYAAGVFRSHGVSIQIRVGLNSGEVVVRAIGNDLHMDYTAVGQTTHLAARMEQLASPGTIRVTADTVRLAEGFITAAPRGPVPVRGLSAPVEVFDLLAALPTRTRLQAAARRGLTPFVGRGHELAELRAALAQAAGGHGRVVAVIGSPGVGKSRLLLEFARSLEAESCLVLESAAVALGRGAASPPAVDLLRSYFAILDTDGPAEIREKVAVKLLALDDSLRAVLPALLSLLEVPTTDQEWSDLDATRRRQRTFDAVKHLIFREAQRQPIILIVDDLHWIDLETQALLDTIVESLPTARLLLLVGYRPEYQHRWGSKSVYAQLRLDLLSRESAAGLLDSLIGRHASLDPLRSRLVEWTDANPFFLEESVRTLAETGALAGAPGAYRLTRPVQSIRVPATVQALLAGRMDRLAPEDKHLLQSMAAIGKDVPWPILQAISEMPENELRRAVMHLQAAELVYEARLFPDLEFTFRHSLTHEVAYESLLRERRAALHARIAAAIEDLYADHLGEHVERLAHHAVAGRLWDKAVTYASRAGAKALAQSAQGAGVAWYEQALAALEHLPQTRERREQAVDLRLELRKALIPLGDFIRVHDVLRCAEELVVELDDERRLGLVYSFLTNYFQVTGDPEQGIAYGQRALAIAERRDDLGTMVVATAFLAQAHLILGDYRASIDYARRCLRPLHGNRLFERFGMANLPSVYSRTALARSLAELSEFGEAAAVAAEALRIAETADHRVSLTLAWFALGFVHLRRGEIDQSIPALERAVELGRVANRIWFRQLASALGVAYAEVGRVNEALALLAEAEAQAASIGTAGSPFGHGVRLAAYAEVLLAAGRVDEAGDVARCALDFLGATKARGYQAWTERLRGAIAARREPLDLAEAGACYERALTQARHLGMRGLVARCYLEMAELGWHDPVAVREHLVTAARLCRDLGMTTQAARAEAVLAKETT